MRKGALGVSGTALERRERDRSRPAPSGDRYAVVRLSLTRFRTYDALRLEVDEGPVVLTGPNGVGKTNLLEALSFLAPGRGLRRARLADVARRPAGLPPLRAGEGPAREEAPVDPQAGNWAVAAVLRTPLGRREIGTGREAGARGGERRVVRIDGAPARGPAALAEVIRVLWLTPEMDRLFGDGTPARRRFLDRLVFGFVPAHAARVAAYERALRDRARLLREGRADPAWLAALENTMAENGVAVAAARRAVTARLDEAAGRAAGPFPQAGVRVAGTVEEWLETLSAEEAEERLRRGLVAARARDALTGGAAVGPHRSDLRVRFRDGDVPAEACSTGEQKALLLSLTLAAARLHVAGEGAGPVILLDEVAAHLDRARRAALFDEICALGVQAWMTGTERALFDGLAGRAQFFAVSPGRVAAHREDG